MDLETIKFIAGLIGDFALPLILLIVANKWLLGKIESYEARLVKSEEVNTELQNKITTRDSENDKKAIGMLKTMWELQHRSNEQLEKIVTNNTDALRSFNANIEQLTLRVKSIEDTIEKVVVRGK